LGHAPSYLKVGTFGVPLDCAAANPTKVITANTTIGERIRFSLMMVYRLAELATDYTDFTDSKSAHGLVRIGPRG
jgi:hypothetical protein